MKRKAFFLDRDGVLNEEVDYLGEPERVVLIPGVAEALNLLHQAGYLAIVVTNQSGIARGKYTLEDMHAVHRRIGELLARNQAAVDDYFFCPHYPEITGVCSCRKPQPGMLLAAAEKYSIDLGASVMIGDRLSDLQAGKAAGVLRNILVLTGYGKITAEQNEFAGFELAENLLTAVHRVLEMKK